MLVALGVSATGKYMYLIYLMNFLFEEVYSTKYVVDVTWAKQEVVWVNYSCFS